MYFFKNTMVRLAHVYLNIGSALWGCWTGTIVYSKGISFLQYNYMDKEKYEITIHGLVISGVIGSILGGGIYHKYILTKP